MTAQQRQYLKQQVSEYWHTYRDALIEAGWIDVCVECHAELDGCTQGCKTCHDRHRRKHRRATDPEYRIRQNEMDKIRRRAKAQAA